MKPPDVTDGLILRLLIVVECGGIASWKLGGRTSTFRIGSDGKLTYTNDYQIDTGGQVQFWSGMVSVS